MPIRPRLRRAESALALSTLALVLLVSAAPAEAAKKRIIERNKELARRFVEEVYNQRQFDKIPEFVSESFVDHSPGAPPEARGTAFVRQQAEGTYEAFPDLRFETLHLIGDGDLVAIHWSSQGTASDQAAGGGAEGKAVTIEGISLFRYDDAGKVVESWDLVDRASLFRQLGFQITPPAAP